MLAKEELIQIKKMAEEFFQKIGIDTGLEFLPPKEKTIFINLKVKKPKILIGERGETLSDIQHLLKAILKKKIKKDFYIDLDVNDYKKRKIKYLKELAKSLADEVALEKKEKILPPMPAYERRVIHLELASRKDVTTESIGKEPERKVVIKPYP
jgi:spoIIIJ-associated protein